MSEFEFPKLTPSQQTGRRGEAHIDQFVTDVLGWIYRPVHRESDFGIDGFVEVVVNDNVTGRGLAVQVKCGNSYVSKKTDGGIKYEGKNKHLNYYLNQNCPVILLVLNSNCEEGYWVEFDKHRTNPTANGWWIEIPKKNRLNKNVAVHWSEIAGSAEDYSEEIKQLWAIDEIMVSANHNFIAIPKEEIQQCSMNYITELVSRLSKTNELALANRGKHEIYFPEYDNDPREINEIPEIRKWFAASLDHGIPWFYFLDTRGRGDSIKMLLFCTFKFEVKETRGNRRVLVTAPEDWGKWLMMNFDNLNYFTEQHYISVEINKERCDAVIECLNNQKATVS